MSSQRVVFQGYVLMEVEGLIFTSHVKIWMVVRTDVINFYESSHHTNVKYSIPIGGLKMQVSEENGSDDDIVMITSSDGIKYKLRAENRKPIVDAVTLAVSQSAIEAERAPKPVVEMKLNANPQIAKLEQQERVLDDLIEAVKQNSEVVRQAGNAAQMEEMVRSELRIHAKRGGNFVFFPFHDKEKEKEKERDKEAIEKKKRAIMSKSENVMMWMTENQLYFCIDGTVDRAKTPRIAFLIYDVVEVVEGLVLTHSSLHSNVIDTGGEDQDKFLSIILSHRVTVGKDSSSSILRLKAATSTQRKDWARILSILCTLEDKTLYNKLNSV